MCESLPYDDPRAQRSNIIKVAYFTVSVLDQAPTIRNVQSVIRRNAGVGYRTSEVANVLRECPGYEQRIARGADFDIVELARLGWREVDIAAPYPAVYALYDGGNLRYIGSTSNLRERLSSHEKKYTKRRVKARYFKPASFGWLSAEARLIARLNPPDNAQYRTTR